MGYFVQMPKTDPFFTNNLISWYLQNKRELPWRNTRDPYLIWISEIILQQTRVAQGLPYYLKFIDRYPSLFDLAQAPQDEVFKLWQGLGYYNRCKNLLATARYIQNELKGIFPKTNTELLTLKGIGSYRAAAIASFAYEEPVAVVDGNVYRVLARYFGIETPIDSGEGKKLFQTIARQLLDKENNSDY